MLLAVEGGGFFSSSATGYSKGLTLLLLGRKNEERPMRVSPWNQYQLVEQGTDPDFQLASGKSRVSRGCAAFVCFRRASAGLEVPSPPKVGPVQQQGVLHEPSSVSDNCEDHNIDHGNTKNGGKFYLKSSLKKPTGCTLVVHEDDDLRVTSEETENNVPVCTGRKVQWTDTCGRDLTEIREFEVSDASGSDDEYDRDNVQTCACVIM